MFGWVKRPFIRKKPRIEKVLEQQIDPPIEKPKRTKRPDSPGMKIKSIQYCSTHGLKLNDNRICPKCEEVASQYSSDFNDPLNNDMNRDGAHGDHFDKRLNDPNKPYIGDQNYNSCPHLIKKGYFCDNCRFVLFHQLRHCPRCGGLFEFRKMCWKEWVETYYDYKEGY